MSGPHEQYVVDSYIQLYGVPDNISDDQQSAIYDGDYTLAIPLGQIIGNLILCRDMLDEAISPYEICDDIDSELEYAISALTEPGAPLAIYDGDEYQNIFYIHNIVFDQSKYSEQLHATILNNIKGIVLSNYNCVADIVCYYPTPLEYKENPAIKIKKDIANIVMREKMDKGYCGGQNYQLTLDKAQENYILGRRSGEDSYPESAKDKSVWDFYLRHGFEEVLNSRLLYRLID